MPDVIAAIATGGALSAIGIIRLSGDGTLDVIDKVFKPQKGGPMFTASDRTLRYGSLCDSGGRVLDFCLCMVSRAPNSYTGEDTAELQCHGSPVVLREALESLFKAGARQASPGEFTKRAFLNGRLDLTQAEAVVDLIESETADIAVNAASQLGGAILRKTENIYGSLVDITSHYHAVLDYPDEDIEDFELASYAGALTGAVKELRRLLDSFERGRIMKEGLKAAIIGRPNVGKSSLLNALLGYERAIVTDIPGTTRDTVAERVVLGGTLLRLIDTAGLRDSGDVVETLGVERAVNAARDCDIVLAVFDGSVGFDSEDEKVIETALASKRAFAVVNKSDLPQAAVGERLSKSDRERRLEARLLEFGAVCHVSAVTGEGLDKLAEAVGGIFGGSRPSDGEILTNARQADAVSRALDGVRSALAALEGGATPDIVLTVAESAMSALGELTGRTVTEDVTARIFERFCVGK